MTRTPLRISFAGGGTDFPAFYERESGAVFSTTINKYIYVTVKQHSELFDERIRLNYSENELVDWIDEIENAIARECLRLLEVDTRIYISTVTDIPGSSGLGSSGSFAVGLLKALYAYRGTHVSAGHLAEEAAYVEMEVLKRPVGKQDQYAAAFGGLNCLNFNPHGGVTVEPQQLPKGGLDDLFDCILLFWTGLTRDSSSILSEQNSNTARNMEHLLTMRDHACQLQVLMHDGFDPLAFGRVLDETWQLKRELANGITNSQIDIWYRRAKEAGALGGKVCGAGGGGFLLFIVPLECQDSVRRALGNLIEIPITYETQGSHLLLSL